MDKRFCDMKQLTLVLVLVGSRGSTQQRNSEDVSAARESVLRLGQYSHAVSELAEIRVLAGCEHIQRRETSAAYFVAAHFELRHIPGRVVVRRPLHEAELSFVRSQIVVEVERKFNY